MEPRPPEAPAGDGQRQAPRSARLAKAADDYWSETVLVAPAWTPSSLAFPVQEFEDAAEPGRAREKRRQRLGELKRLRTELEWERQWRERYAAAATEAQRRQLDRTKRDRERSQERYRESLRQKRAAEAHEREAARKLREEKERARRALRDEERARQREERRREQQERERQRRIEEQRRSEKEFRLRLHKNWEKGDKKRMAEIRRKHKGAEERIGKIEEVHSGQQRMRHAETATRLAIVRMNRHLREQEAVPVSDWDLRASRVEENVETAQNALRERIDAKRRRNIKRTNEVEFLFNMKRDHQRRLMEKREMLAERKIERVREQVEQERQQRALQSSRKERQVRDELARLEREREQFRQEVAAELSDKQVRIEALRREQEIRRREHNLQTKFEQDQRHRLHVELERHMNARDIDKAIEALILADVE